VRAAWLYYIEGLTPEEVALSKAMKVISPASAALRTAAQQSKPDVIATNVAALAPAFAQAETIWDTALDKFFAQRAA